VTGALHSYSTPSDPLVSWESYPLPRLHPLGARSLIQSATGQASSIFLTNWRLWCGYSKIHHFSTQPQNQYRHRHHNLNQSKKSLNMRLYVMQKLMAVKRCAQWD